VKFYERFEMLLKSRGVTIAELSKTLEIPYTTLDSIIKKKQNGTGITNTSKIANYFGVTTDWLATGVDFQNDSELKELSPYKKMVIEKINKLDESSVKAILAFMSSLENMKD
jgi:plasmid maintenance system antidote protein VapI